MAHKEQKFIPLHFDTEAINQDVPIRAVIQRYAGIDTDVRGNIRCPSPTHVDNKPSAAIYDRHPKNNCYCFSCNTNFTPITVVMENTHSSLPEACQMLIRDFGLSMSRYSNIDEVERAKAARSNNADEISDYYETFPLSKEECDTIGVDLYSQKIPNSNYDEEVKYNPDCPRYFHRPSIMEMWQEDKESVEEMLVGICHEYMTYMKNSIDAEKKSFFSIYSLHTKSEWNEAQKLLDAKERYNITLFSDITMTLKQRHYISDIEDLQETAERIAVFEDKYIEYENIAKKINEQQEERRKAMEKLRPVQQGRE